MSKDVSVATTGSVERRASRPDDDTNLSSAALWESTATLRERVFTGRRGRAPITSILGEGIVL
ncbi:MAG: hypothetical protein ACSLE6_16650 [Mycobacterium sp.]